ncbi:P-type cation-transporting ATPase like protein [Verticillium longisporum]|nr:P-type cation-transporting ATPase like protein [Verticillium longisporum]KAG7149878.1 P-type cation-transporting ATPase like protein [Verticillium longisporum]
MLEFASEAGRDGMKRGWASSFALAILVQLIAVPEFYRPAISALVYSHVLEMDMLVVISITAAFLYSIARYKAVSAMSLRSLLSNTAVLIENGNDREIDARLLQFSDHFKVLPHSRVPIDGIVLTGSSEIDKSMLTSELIPILKQAGDYIITGTINSDGTIVVRNYLASKLVADAISYAITVLAISYPYMLGLAIPIVLIIASSIVAKGGIIIKLAEYTERARKCTDVIFDKTSTITEGDLDIIADEYLDLNRKETIAISKALISSGKHPISAAIDKRLANIQPLASVTDVRIVPGAGIEANINVVTSLQENGLITLIITRDHIPIAVFGLRTQLRPEVAQVIAELKALPPKNVAAERTPAEKRDYVASVMEDPNKYVIFCGDGTNNAVAVAQANIGAQMGGAISLSDVTQSAADVVLLAGLDGIPFLLNSAIYNVVAILLAAGAFVNFRLEPAFAGLAEIVSVLPVIFAATSMLLLNLQAAHMVQTLRASGFRTVIVGECLGDPQKNWHRL